LGEATGSGAAFDNGDTVAISLADATGTADALQINVENDAAGTDAALDISGVESITLKVSADTNDATVSMTEAEASSITVTGGAAGALLAMGTLDAATNTIDASAYKGEVSFSGASVTSAMTVTASSSAADDNFTLSGRNDTVTIGETGAVDVDVDGGAGDDTLNLTVTTGFVDTGEIDNIETINFTVAAGTDIFIGANGTAATDANAIAEATTVTISGGNSLSTFEVGDSDGASADNITATTNIDASTFEGNINLEFNTDVITSSTSVKGGALTTDVVRGLFDTTNTDVSLNFSGVDTFIAKLNSGDTAANEQYTFDMDKMSGLTTIAVESSNGEDTLLDIDNYVGTVTVELGAAFNGTTTAYDSSSQVDINLANQYGTADVAKLKLTDTDDQAGTIDIDAAGVEDLQITVGTGSESHKLDLAGVTATTGQKTAITLTGGVSTDGVEFTTVATTVNKIDASAMKGTFTLTDRGSDAMTITGGTANDSLRMENAADVISAGDGTGDTLVVAMTAGLGAIAVDLSATGDQVSTVNGVANTAVQSGFENVDVSGYTVSGASITGSKEANTITGTNQTDQITTGKGVDTVASGGGVDYITLAASDGNDDVIQLKSAEIGASISVGQGAVSADIVYNFETGASGDQIEISLAAIDAITGVTDFVFYGNAGADVAASSTMAVDKDADAANDAGDAATAVIGLVQGVADLQESTVETALEAAGSNALTFNGASSAADAFLIAADNGTDTAMFLIVVGGDGVTNDGTAATGELTAIKLLTFDGLATAESLHADNFDIIA